MAKLTQGTSLFWIDGTTVRQVAATNINGLSAHRDSIETTDLESDAKTFMPGLMSPGSAQFAIQFDTSNDTHTALHELARRLESAAIAVALGFVGGC